MGQCSTLPAQEGHSNMYNNGDTVDNSNHSSSNWPVQQRDDVAASHQQRYRASPTVTSGVGKLHHHHHLNTNQHNAMDTPSDDPTTPLTARHRSNQNSTSGYHLQVETIEQQQQQQQQQQHTHHVPSDQFGQMHVVDVNPPMSSPASNNNATGYAGQPQMMHGKTAGVGESSPMSPRLRLRRRHHHHQSNQQPNISSPLGGIEEQLVQQKQEPEIPLPPPPENAVRKRCYKLNLESDVIGTTNNNENSANPGVKGRQPLMGPFLDDPPPLTYSSSDDSSAGVTSTTVAVETAQIFRGIVVSKDAMIIKQNARASRGGSSSSRAGAAGSSSSKQKQKRGEKSRQASKIDKAKDLVEQEVESGKKANSEDPAKMESLVSMGEYDEMKCLVRDGSKKLREAKGFSDDVLLSLNRRRGGDHQQQLPPPPPMSPSSTKKRISSPYVPTGTQPYHQQQQHHQQQHASPRKSTTTSMPPRNSSSSTISATVHAVPPKIKGHPRDYPTSRRILSNEPRQEAQQTQTQTHTQTQTQTPKVHHRVDDDDDGGDWSSSLNLSRGFNSFWNCGTTPSGTISPTQGVNEPTKTQSAVSVSQSHNHHQYSHASASQSPHHYQQHHHHQHRRRHHQHQHQHQHHYQHTGGGADAVATVDGRNELSQQRVLSSPVNPTTTTTGVERRMNPPSSSPSDYNTTTTTTTTVRV